MSRHESLVRFRHIPDHAREAVAMAGKTRADLEVEGEMNLTSVSALRSHRAWPPVQPRPLT
jgi:hypothetical protein